MCLRDRAYLSCDDVQIHLKNASAHLKAHPCTPKSVTHVHMHKNIVALNGLHLFLELVHHSHFYRTQEHIDNHSTDGATKKNIVS